MKNFQSLLNIAGIGCAVTVTFAGISFKNPHLAFTGINSGMLVGFANSLGKKLQLQQQNNSVSTVIDSLTQQIINIQQKTQQQQQQFDRYQQNIQQLQLEQSQTLEQQNYLDLQIENLVNNIEDTNKNLQTIQLQQQETTTAQNKLSFVVNNTQQQLKNHNKKLKKQQHQINTQQTNHNQFFSQIQKLKNQQTATTTNQTKYLSEITAQVDKLIETAPKQPAIIAQSNIQKKMVNPILQRKPQTLCYIDNNNLYNCLKEMGIKLDYKVFLSFITAKTGKTQIKLYDGAFPNQKYRYSYLKQYGYQIKTLPIIKRGQNQFKTVGDDVQLAIDMVKDVKSRDSVILVTGDGDLLPAVKEIKQRNINLTIIAKKRSVNQDLRKLADKFISLESIKFDIAKHTLFPA